MPTANEALRDATISHQVDLAQYSTHVVRRMIGVLNRADAELSAALQGALARMDGEAFTVERLELVLSSVRAVNLAAYRAVERELTEELARFAEVEAGVQADMLRAAVPEPVAAVVSFVRVEPAQVYAAAMSRPFQGRLLREWAQHIEDRRMWRIRETIRSGFTTGKTIDQMVREVRGTRAAQYSDGIMNASREEARSVVRTAIQHLAANVRDATHAANADIIKAIKWSATLDGRTSDGCRIRDGKQYRNTERHEPIGHKIPWGGGPGKLHWNCRSSGVAVLKSLAELSGLDIGEDWPQSTRASMDGQVPANLSYGDWLKKQSAERQDEVVGPTRGKLMREGKLPFDALYTDRGAVLTLEELRARHPGAFRRAGV